MKAKTKRKNQIYLRNSDILASKLTSQDLPLEEVLSIISTFKNTFFNSASLELELLIANGFPLEIQNKKVLLKTARTRITDQTFCIVDIETNASNIQKGQIIELGAVKYKNGKIIDKIDSLVYAKDIPPYIQEVTNITPLMLEDAPKIQDVLEEFKMFLEDDIFVAHDIKFDYKFISDSFEKYDLGVLENRKLCTIDLSKRTIKAQRYGLDFLKDLLNIDIAFQHRAYSDALSTTYILEHALEKLPNEIQVSEDLLVFAKSNNIINPAVKHFAKNNTDIKTEEKDKNV